MLSTVKVRVEVVTVVDVAVRVWPLWVLVMVKIWLDVRMSVIVRVQVVQVKGSVVVLLSVNVVVEH